MLNNKLLIGIAFLFVCTCATARAQRGTQFSKAQSPTTQTPIIAKDSIGQKEAYDPLRPSKAAFYAAVVPGLGQAYNKDYWKIPIVYGALGTGVFVAIDSDREFQRFRDAFKDRLAGRIDEFTVVDELTGEPTQIFSDDALIRGQDLFRRRKELAILVTAGMYVLQIIEANVDAHLTQYDVDDDLTFAPDFHMDDLGVAMHYGFKLTYTLD